MKDNKRKINKLVGFMVCQPLFSYLMPTLVTNDNDLQTIIASRNYFSYKQIIWFQVFLSNTNNLDSCIVSNVST